MKKLVFMLILIILTVMAGIYYIQQKPSYEADAYGTGPNMSPGYIFDHNAHHQ